MATIEQLSPGVINKIAAGEVIERPASLLKELMENAVDAGASRIDVTVEKGGSQLVRIADDGHGIDPEQLPLAVASHATSKLRTADDLYHVSTLGFRGEALASIGSVSRMVIRSRPHQVQTGGQIEVIGGRIEPVVPCGGPAGTTVDVRDIFFNTPVRRKFLRTPQTEMSHCTEAFTRIALACPRIHFTLTHNRRTLYELPPTDDWRGRIGRFFGADLADALIAVEGSDGNIRLHGYVASPTHSRANARLQYLLLNGRAIRDRSLQHALSEAYRGLLMTGRYPICFLHLEVPPEIVDVNVHPTKAEVRFQDSGRLYRHLLGTLRTRFLTSDLTARYQRGAEQQAGGAAGALGAVPAGAEPPGRTGELEQWARRELGPSPLHREGTDRAVQSHLTWGRQDAVPPAASPAAPTASAAHRTVAPTPADRSAAPRASLPDPPPAWEVDDTAPRRSAGTPALQVHNRYLVAETEDGIVVIDQHALHERILYEQIREKVTDGAIESQALLVPEPVDLTASEAAAILEQRDLLRKLGVEVEPFGGETVLVSAYPAMLANLQVADVIRDVADQLLGGGKPPDARDLLDDLLQMISCKAAVKAGDRLTPDEVASLVEQRHLARDGHHCPHGRPTALELTRADLDRQFKRT